MTQPKRQPRAARWLDAAEAAEAAVNTLQAIQEEYQEWLDSMPENLADSPVAEKLNTICDLDLDSAIETLSEAVGADLPLGFGRD